MAKRSVVAATHHQICQIHRPGRNHNTECIWKTKSSHEHESHASDALRPWGPLPCVCLRRWLPVEGKLLCFLFLSSFVGAGGKIYRMCFAILCRKNRVFASPVDGGWKLCRSPDPFHLCCTISIHGHGPHPRSHMNILFCHDSLEILWALYKCSSQLLPISLPKSHPAYSLARPSHLRTFLPIDPDSRDFVGHIIRVRDVAYVGGSVN